MVMGVTLEARISPTECNSVGVLTDLEGLGEVGGRCRCPDRVLGGGCWVLFLEGLGEVGGRCR